MEDRNTDPKKARPDTPVHLEYVDQRSLQGAYMPFIAGGALFFSTEIDYVLGDKIELSVDLPDANNLLSVSTEVVWKTPAGALGGRPAGVGVKFIGTEGVALRSCISGILQTI